MAGKHDDTVIVRPLRPPARRSLPWVALAAGTVLAVAGGAATWMLRPAAVPTVAAVASPAAPPAAPSVTTVLFEPIPLASEAAIVVESPAVRTVLRFADNPAIVVIDFPTLQEQGRMLNRIAAWAEKAGVPHDHLLDDVALAAAIRASGTTPDTYYYGHDYRGADIARFFAMADRDGIALNDAERELRRLADRARAEPPGFGALVTIVRAEGAGEITPRMRATVLHHELSHGEYFTNPAYAAYVDTVWQTMLTPGERAAFRTYLAAEGYDPALEDLMRNEMQAYLMHTPDAQFFDPGRLGIPAARLQQLRMAFLAGMPPGWLKVECGRLLPALPVPPPARGMSPARPRRRQRPGRVSTGSAVATTVPPRRRRLSMAACKPAR